MYFIFTKKNKKIYIRNFKKLYIYIYIYFWTLSPFINTSDKDRNFAAQNIWCCTSILGVIRVRQHAMLYDPSSSRDRILLGTTYDVGQYDRRKCIIFNIHPWWVAGRQGSATPPSGYFWFLRSYTYIRMISY